MSSGSGGEKPRGPPVSPLAASASRAALGWMDTPADQTDQEASVQMRKIIKASIASFSQG